MHHTEVFGGISCARENTAHDTKVVGRNGQIRGVVTHPVKGNIGRFTGRVEAHGV
jgi:hypothetical protein